MIKNLIESVLALMKGQMICQDLVVCASLQTPTMAMISTFRPLETSSKSWQVDSENLFPLQCKQICNSFPVPVEMIRP